MVEIKLFICIKMDLALNNLQWLICHKTKSNLLELKSKIRKNKSLLQGLKNKIQKPNTTKPLLTQEDGINRDLIKNIITEKIT